MTPPDIKICGLSTPQSVAAALEGGATHVGFIFFPKSPRNVTPEQAAALAAPARGRAIIVAVTVDAEDAFLDDIVAQLKPDLLQLHGHESPERVTALKARYGLPVMKAVSVRGAEDLDAIAAYVGVADRLLLDAKPPKGADLPGGNGVSFDWALLDGLNARVGYGLDRPLPYMLSGGINLSNLETALTRVRPAGLDVSSGVEKAPGVKDDRLIREFLAEAARIARGADARSEMHDDAPAS